MPSGPNIVISRDPKYAESHQEGCIVLTSLKEALEQAGKLETNGEIFIFGGGQIFEQAIGLADRLYLTMVEGDFKADTFFPDYSDFKKRSGSQRNWNQQVLSINFWIWKDKGIPRCQ